MNDHNTADVVAKLVKDHIKPEFVTLDAAGNRAVILPAGLEPYSIKELVDEYRTVPERRKGTASLQDLASFVAHANRFKCETSAIFADPTKPSLVSVLDYHPAGPKNEDARHGGHRGLYLFPLSDEWKAWKDLDKKPLGQAEFAEMVETRITDFADPAGAGESAKTLSQLVGCQFASPSRLLELSRGLTVRVGARVQNATNLATGEASMRFESAHSDEAGAPLKVPGAFLIAVPVFRSGAMYQLAARLRYRVQGPSVTWFYELYRPERAFDHAFREACDTAQKETDLPLFVGSAE